MKVEVITIELAEVVPFQEIIACDIESHNEIIAEIIDTDDNEIGLPLLIVIEIKKYHEILPKVVVFLSVVIITFIILLMKFRKSLR